MRGYDIRVPYFRKLPNISKDTKFSIGWRLAGGAWTMQLAGGDCDHEQSLGQCANQREYIRACVCVCVCVCGCVRT